MENEIGSSRGDQANTFKIACDNAAESTTLHTFFATTKRIPESV